MNISLEDLDFKVWDILDSEEKDVKSEKKDKKEPLEPFTQEMYDQYSRFIPNDYTNAKLETVMGKLTNDISVADNVNNIPKQSITDNIPRRDGIDNNRWENRSMKTNYDNIGVRVSIAQAMESKGLWGYLIELFTHVNRRVKRLVKIVIGFITALLSLEAIKKYIPKDLLDKINILNRLAIRAC